MIAVMSWMDVLSFLAVLWLFTSLAFFTVVVLTGRRNRW